MAALAGEFSSIQVAVRVSISLGARNAGMYQQKQSGGLRPPTGMHRNTEVVHQNRAAFEINGFGNNEHMWYQKGLQPTK